MDSFQTVEAKFNNIRHAIREVILPLVQAIYIEDPPDITFFCAQYFDALQKGKEGDKTTLKEVNDSDEVDKCILEHKEQQGETDILKANIQGSTSLPVLVSDKNSEDLPLRETSSWNEPRNNLQGNRFRQNVGLNAADVMSQIGDQASTVVPEEDISGIHVKTGDAPMMKNEKFQDERSDHNVSEYNASSDVTKKEKESDMIVTASVSNEEDEIAVHITKLEQQQPDVTPSAPPYEEYNKSSKSTKKDSTAEPLKVNIIKDEKVVDEVSDSTKSNASDDTPCRTQESICRGNLSPNSSFGFIPQLKEHESEQDMERDEYNDFKNKNSKEIENLTKKFTEAFRGIAQEFNSAESNLNSVFLKAKEISDVIQFQDKSHENSLDAKSVNEYDINNKSCYSDQINLDIKVQDGSTPEGVIEEDNDIKNEISECKIGSTNRSLKITISDTQETEDFNISDDVKDSVNKICDAVGENLENVTKSAFEDDNISIEPEREIDIAKSDPSLPKNEENDDDDDNRPRIYESWRERWYESHPRLNIGGRFQPKVMKSFRVHPSFTDHRRNPMMHRIGEAGDVPLARRLQTTDGSYSRTLDCSSDASSSSSEKFSVDDVQERMNIGTIMHESSNKNQTNKNVSNISSQSVPYSWRKMNFKQQTSHLESSEPRSKAPRLTPSKDRFDHDKDLQITSRETSPKCDPEEPISEIMVQKETGLTNNLSCTKENQVSEEPESNNPTPLGTGEKLYDFINEDVVKNEEVSPLTFKDVVEKYHNGLNDLSSQDKEVENIKSSFSANEGNRSLYTDGIYENISLETKSDLNEFSESQNDITEKHNVNDNEECSTSCMQSSPLNGEKKELDEDKKTENGVKRSESKNTNSGLKTEPGLNSACGDSALTNVSGVDENNPESEPRYLEPINDVLIDSHVSSGNTPSSHDQITVQYLQEAIQHVLQQQKSEVSDDYDGLNFSSISESESSNLENSDLSENEDFNISSNT